MMVCAKCRREMFPRKNGVLSSYQCFESTGHVEVFDGDLWECSECGALRKGGLPCPACGFLPKRPAEYIHFADEDLVQVGTRSLSWAWAAGI